LDRYQSEFVTLGNSISLIDIVKETHQALSHDQSYSIPTSRELLAQELLLFENNAPEDLERIVDSLFSQTRVTVMAPWMDALLYGDLNQEVQQIFEDAVGDKADIYVTGMLPMLGSTLDSVIVTMAESYITALVVIGIMMMLLLGSARDGALAMFPNILPIVMVMGLMIPLNIPLDLFTMLVASVAIGVAVDDTVHFMHHFKRNFVKSGNVQQAVHATITTAGRAMLTTGCVLAGGFFVFSLSRVQNIANFGLLACLTIVLAVLANFLLTPALMILSYRQKYDKNLNLSQEGTTHEQ
jgi:predicted RND superfamily exporter protein